MDKLSIINLKVLRSSLLIGLGTLTFNEHNAGSSPVYCTKLMGSIAQSGRAGDF